MTQILYLFPDTNLFIQCRDLQELDWSEWKDFSEVHLIVCLPVQQEIDQQKTRGENNRVGRRARKTYSTFFRPIATDEKEYELIRNDDPKVKLFLESPSWPDPELSDRLDYSKPDNEIVGCLSRYTKTNRDADVRLLTHDTGPMMTAKGLGLSVAPIRDEWILPPEHNKVERENIRLKSEIAQLKKLEPLFQITCLDDKDQEVQELQVECKVYEPLCDGDIQELINLLKSRSPIATEFGGKGKSIDPTTVGINAFVASVSTNPPSPIAIADYREREYPDWIDSCRRVLSNLHRALQRDVGQPQIRFSIENRGTRPGRDTLVEFLAQGKFKLAPPEDDLPDGFYEEESIKLSLPRPPKPPRGRSFMEDLANITSPDYSNALMTSILTDSDPQRDPNGFYYKPDVPTEPVNVISLTCDQWRHGLGGETFVVEICGNPNSDEVRGKLECVVQADNISNPVRKHVGVRIDVIKMNTKDYAYKLIGGQAVA